MFEYISKYLDFKPNDLVADIGGNDGSLLSQFKRENPFLKLVNIDCSQTFRDINEGIGVQYIEEYFNNKIELPYKAKLITSTNVFQTHGRNKVFCTRN